MQKRKEPLLSIALQLVSGRGFRETIIPLAFDTLGNPDGNLFMVHRLPDAVAGECDPLVEGIRYVELPAADLTETANWYVEKLGFERAGISMGNPEVAFLDMNPGPHLLLRRTAERTNANIFRGDDEHHVVGFRTSRMDELYRFLSENGVRVTEIEDQGAIGRFIHFYDPNGNLFMAHEVPA